MITIRRQWPYLAMLILATILILATVGHHGQSDASSTISQPTATSALVTTEQPTGSTTPTLSPTAPQTSGPPDLTHVADFEIARLSLQPGDEQSGNRKQRVARFCSPQYLASLADGLTPDEAALLKQGGSVSASVTAILALPGETDSDTVFFRSEVSVVIHRSTGDTEQHFASTSQWTKSANQWLVSAEPTYGDADAKAT